MIVYLKASAALSNRKWDLKEESYGQKKDPRGKATCCDFCQKVPLISTKDLKLRKEQAYQPIFH